MIYQKSDLLYKDYDWNNSIDDVKFKGEPDRNIFMRNEGNDVLYLINFICVQMMYVSKAHAARLEIMIHEKLPLEIISQKGVFNWIQNNYVA